MNPFIKSLAELMLITESRSKLYDKPKKYESKSLSGDNIKEKIHKYPKVNQIISLPNIRTTTRKKWAKSKEKVSKILDELDYNNQIQSTYDLTLIERQSYYDKKDVA